MEFVCRLLGEPPPVEEEEEVVTAKSHLDGAPVHSSPNGGHDPTPSNEKRANRPRLFIGSTTEALEIARAVHAELEDDVDVTVWPQDVFVPNAATWIQLIKLAREDTDFGLFVFSGDDVVESRGVTIGTPRDNILLEYGLFVGAHGIEKTFMLINRDRPVKIASDLAGIPPLTYKDRADGNLRAAVATACNTLRRQLKANHK